MDEFERRIAASRAAAAAAYPAMDPATATAVAAHAAQYRAAAAAVAAVYPELGRGAPTTSAGGSTSSVPTPITDAAGFHTRFSPGALSIGTGAGLPFLNSLFSGSIPPPPTSPYRNAHGGLVSMRPFWPPTPPPDTYSRCGLSGNYYPMFSSSLVPSTADSSHYASHNLQLPSRITTANSTSFTNIFDPHKDVPYLSPTLRLGSSPLTPNHSLPQHSPTSPSSHFLHLPSTLERHALSYLQHSQSAAAAVGALKAAYDFSPQGDAELATTRLASPIESGILKKEHSDSMTNLADKSSYPTTRTICVENNNNNNIEVFNKKEGKTREQPKVAAVKVYKHKPEELKPLNKPDVDTATKDRKPVVDESTWSYPLNSKSASYDVSSHPTTVANSHTMATVSPSIHNHKANGKSKKLSVIPPTWKDTSKCCSCATAQEEIVKVEESTEDQEIDVDRPDENGSPTRKDLSVPLVIETASPLLAPKVELISPDVQTTSSVSPVIDKSKRSNDVEERLDSTKNDIVAAESPIHGTVQPEVLLRDDTSASKVTTTKSTTNPVSPSPSYLPPTSSCTSVVTTSISSSCSSSLSSCSASHTCTQSSWVHPKDTSVSVTTVINNTEKKKPGGETAKVTPHIGATPLPVPHVKTYLNPSQMVLSQSARIASSKSNKFISSIEKITLTVSNNAANKSDNKSAVDAAEAVNLCLGKTQKMAASPLLKRTINVDNKVNTSESKSDASAEYATTTVGAAKRHADHVPTVNASCDLQSSNSVDKDLKSLHSLAAPGSSELTRVTVVRKECKPIPSLREPKVAQSVKPNQHKLLNADPSTPSTVDQQVAINLSLNAKKCATDSKLRSPERGAFANAIKTPDVASSTASLNALSRLVSTTSSNANSTTEVVTSTSWNYRGVQKVKPSSMVSSVQSENLSCASADKVSKEKLISGPKITLSISTSSTMVTTSRPTISTCTSTFLTKSKVLPAAQSCPREPLIKSNSLNSPSCPNAVLSMQETVSSTMLSVTSSVIPNSVGNSSIPVGIAVAQLRQDSSNITVKRSLPVSSGIESSPTHCPPLATVTRPICMDKTESSDTKKGSRTSTETNILVSQVNNSSHIPVTHWDTESLVRTSLPNSWLTAAPVVASTPVVTPTVWVGQAPFTTPSPTATTTLNSLDASQLPIPPVGFQLARDPLSGQMFLLPASNIEIVDRSNIWSAYTPGTVQQIVTQPTAFHQQIIQQVTNGTKTEVKPCIAQIKKTFLQPNTVHTTNHIEAAHETKEVKVIGAGGLNATVQSTVAGITVQSNQPFTFPGFTATNGVPATLSYFYEPSTILHLTQAQATTALQPTSIHASAIAPSVLQTNGLQVTGVQSTTGIQITNIQQPQNLHTQFESYKRSQATSPLNSFSPSMDMHQANSVVNMTAADSADDDDAEYEDSESETFMDSQIPKPNSTGVTMAIQVDMDVSTDDNDYEDHQTKAVVEVHDSANQTDTLYSDSAKEDTGDECSRGTNETSLPCLPPTRNREAEHLDSNDARCSVTNVVFHEAHSQANKTSMEVQTDELTTFAKSSHFTENETRPNVVEDEQTRKTQSLPLDVLPQSLHVDGLPQSSHVDGVSQSTQAITEVLDNNCFPETYDATKFVPASTIDTVPQLNTIETETPPVTQTATEKNPDLERFSSQPEVQEDFKDNVPNEDPDSPDNGNALMVEEEVLEEENPPLLPTKSHMVMDFIDHHGLDLLVDSIEEFASREEQGVPVTMVAPPPTKDPITIKEHLVATEKKPIVVDTQVVPFEPNFAVTRNHDEPTDSYVCDIDPSYTDGLGILCALAEQRFLEEHKKFAESGGNSLQPERSIATTNVNETSPTASYSTKKASSSRDSSPSKYSNHGQQQQQQQGAKSVNFPSFTSDDSMDPSEVEMRFKLAELQRKYKEKQRELAKLKPKKEKDSESESYKKERPASKSKKTRLSMFTSKYGMSFPYLQIPEDGGLLSDSHSESSSFSPPAVILQSSPALSSPAKKKRKLEKDAATSSDFVASSTKQSGGSPASRKVPSSSKKNNIWSPKVKSDAGSTTSKSSSTSKLDYSNKKAISKPNKSVASSYSKDSETKKGPEFSISTVKPQAIMSPRTSSDSEGERLFVQFWINQRAEKLAAANNAKSNESSAKSSKEKEKTTKQSTNPTVLLKPVSEKPKVPNEKSEAIKKVRKLETFELDTSESEDLPEVKKAKTAASQKPPPTTDKVATVEDTSKPLDETKPKKIKLESSPTEEKLKPKKKITNTKLPASPADATWNRRRSERIFLHDAGVVLPSTFVLVDEQSNGSICRDILIEPAKPVAQKCDPEICQEKIKKPQIKTDTDDSKEKRKFKKEKEKSVPDELFTALRQCRLSEAASAAVALGTSSAQVEPKAISTTRTSTQSDESSFSEGDVPLSVLIEKNAAQSVSELPSCILTPDKLVDQQRVITLDEDLYYAGYIKAIQAPDVYGIVLDGERGNKPHIFSREEILTDALIEIKPTNTNQIPIGSRVCAYWSQQYRHLYPGTVAKATCAKHMPDKGMVFVEFDDGDSGRIPIEDIRILPKEYPIESQKNGSDSNDALKSGQDLAETNGNDPKDSEEPTLSMQSVSAQESENKVKNKKNKKLSKTFTKKSSKKSSDCQSPASNGSDSSSIIPLSFLKNKSLLKKKSKKNKGISSKNKVKDSHRSSKRFSDTNSSVYLTSSPNDESSNSGSLSSGKIKKKKKHKTEHKHKHHHHRHHCHHSHHHKKHKHDKSRSNTLQSSSNTMQNIVPVSSTSDNALTETKKPDKIIVSVPVLPAVSVSATPLEPATSNAAKPAASKEAKEKKADLTVKIKTSLLDEAAKSQERVAKKARVEVEQVDLKSYSESELVIVEDVVEKEPEKKERKVPKKKKERQSSVEKSKIAAFLPAQQLWRWSGKSFKRQKTKGKGKKEYYKAITRGQETIKVGDCAVFLSTGRPHLPYVGRIDTMWESWGGTMIVKVVWFYHPEETKGGKKISHSKGALYESSHVDENEVQTISHKCEVLSWSEFQKFKEENKSGAARYDSTIDSEDVYYLAGTYEPTAKILTLAPGVS